MKNLYLVSEYWEENPTPTPIGICETIDLANKLANARKRYGEPYILMDEDRCMELINEVGNYEEMSPKEIVNEILKYNPVAEFEDAYRSILLQNVKYYTTPQVEHKVSYEKLPFWTDENIEGVENKREDYDTKLEQDTKEFTVTIDENLKVSEITAKDCEWYVAKDWSDYAKNNDKENVQLWNETIVNYGDYSINKTGNFNSTIFKIVVQPPLRDEDVPKFTVIYLEEDIQFEFSAEDGKLLKEYVTVGNEPMLREYKWCNKTIPNYDMWKDYCVNNIPAWLDRANSRERSLTNRQFIMKVWRGENPFEH